MPPEASSQIATVPAGFQLNPIDAYHRRHHAFPAKGLVQKAFEKKFSALFGK
jgi:hypothetical protein